MDALMPKFAHGVGVFAGYIPHINIAVYGDEVCDCAAFDLRKVVHLFR